MTLRIVLAQLNLHVGDIDYNVKKHIEAATYARDTLHADIIVFPELSITGYPPEDLLLRPAFLEASNHALSFLTNTIEGIHCLIGHPLQSEKGLQNACSMIFNKQIIGQYAKQHLPNYSVFDERRYFVPGGKSFVVNIKNTPIGIVICEDAWFKGPTQAAQLAGAQIVLSPNASPFEINKHQLRVDALKKRATQNQVTMVYVNQIGGQDELVFDGGSFVMQPDGEISHFAGFFNENLLAVDIDVNKRVSRANLSLPSDIENIYHALVLGVRDYVKKNKFEGVIVGASGGIDSALTLAIAVDALGADHVQAILMPSRFNAEISLEDAVTLANHLQIHYEMISIEPAFNAFLQSLQNNFADKKRDLTEENIQSRTRAVLLMAISNKHGKLVLTTGNRSELAVGYCTLYGDMAGAYAPLKDIYKTEVYQLATYRNTIGQVIPERTISRAPSAELAFNQTDQDLLPPYDVLDQLLIDYLDESLDRDAIIAKGLDAALVDRIIHLIRKNEYKRKQAPIGTHIRLKSFGKDWRYPLTNGFKK